MNLILFHAAELDAPLPRTDPRATHMLDVLLRAVGDDCDVGLINGPRGKARIERLEDDFVTLSFRWGEAEPELDPITLIVGLSRPQTNRKVLRAAATMGVRRILFPSTDRGDRSYVDSKLWTTGEYRRQLLAGVEQAFATRVPDVDYGMPLGAALEQARDGEGKLALDNYEASSPLHECPAQDWKSHNLVVGSERGWSAEERNLLRSSGYPLVSLGERVLRTETAVVSGLTLLKANGGYWS